MEEIAYSVHDFAVILRVGIFKCIELEFNRLECASYIELGAVIFL